MKSIISKLIQLFILLIFFIIQANAKEFESQYSLDELLTVIEKNPAIKSAEFFAIAQKNFANQEKYWQNPQLNYGFGNNHENYTASQTVPFFGKLETKFKAEDAQFRILENQKNNLILNIKAHSFFLIYAYNINNKKIILAQKRIARLSLIDRFLSSINLTSPTQKAQSQITKDKIKLIKNELLKLQYKQTQLWNSLNVYLGFSERISINTPWLNNSSFPSVDKLLEQALNSNYNLQEQKIILEKYHAQLQYNQLEKMPDIALSLSNNKSNYNGSNSNSNSVGVSISIPIFNRNQQKILGTYSQIKAQENQIEFTKNMLINELASDINFYQTNLKIADDFSLKIIDQSLARLNQANLDFKKGILEFITYIELDSQEYNAIDVALDTQVQLANAYSNLMVKIGNFIIPNAK